MEAEPFEEGEFFRVLSASGARVLLIGRRAIAALGLPVLTADYDLWAHPDDIAVLNGVLAPVVPNHSPDEARTRGRYVLENGDHVDVLVARQQSTKDGVVVRFEDVWERRRYVEFEGNVSVAIPSIPDLILTKRWAMREKDVVDIQPRDASEGGQVSDRDDESPSLSPEEFDRRVAIALADEEEMANLRSLVVWFCRRYPTAKERLAYVRRRHADWTRRPKLIRDP